MSNLKIENKNIRRDTERERENNWKKGDNKHENIEKEKEKKRRERVREYCVGRVLWFGFMKRISDG